MPVHIKRLRCRVTVHTGKRDAPLAHQTAGPLQPSMDFALPRPETRAEAEQTSKAVTEQSHSRAETAPVPKIKKADARLVADRVYEMMTQEIVHARQRGGSGRKG